ncbi:MAG TPA: tyrosine--tRNA ligase, partial [Patescibacteria group bacterium]|nr:tyrosine--tRNA ligase [Patescibacteria group bacterium]
ANFTVQQMLERDMFEKRINNGKPVGLHEFLYPLMQGYDSVAMEVDGELGGNDQTFNMLAGRTLMKNMLNKEKFVMTNKLLVDSEGKKMGKTEGNMISLGDSAKEIFGKVMSWSDDMIDIGFELCTFVPKNEYKKIIKENKNPRDQKIILAEKIVTIYFDQKSAEQEKENFINTFAKKKTPENITGADLAGKSILEVLVKSGMVDSKSQARRDIQGGGVKINQEKVGDSDFEIKVKSGDIVQKGKRHFLKIN